MKARRFIVGSIVSLVLIAVASILILHFRTPAEPLMQACGPTRWPPNRFPLIVVLEPSHPEWAPVLERAAARWGDGLVLFGGIESGTQNRAGVVPFSVEDFGLGADDDLHGDTLVGFDQCWIASARTRAPAETPEDLRERVAAHEMGHELGLGHSDDEGDVMYRRALRGAFQVSRQLVFAQ